MLPRTHGSALFTRGETQALVTVTLGTSEDMQIIDTVQEPDHKKRFMLHYNFPPFSVGEVKFLRGPGRREIGHGALAERVAPRDAARRGDVPLHHPHRLRHPGVQRLVLDGLHLRRHPRPDGRRRAHQGAGGRRGHGPRQGRRRATPSCPTSPARKTTTATWTSRSRARATGITALQMDIKIGGITAEILAKALEQAREGRLHILDKMAEALGDAAGRASAAYAPRILTIQVPVDKIRDIIGPGGKMIRSIVERTGCKIDVEDDGRVSIASVDEAAARKAIAIIEELTATAELNKTYLGKVVRVVEFGAFVEILPGTDGLLHVSEMAHHRVQDVRSEVKEGDQVLVKVVNIDPSGKIRLSRKALIEAAPGRRPRRRRLGSRRLRRRAAADTTGRTASAARRRRDRGRGGDRGGAAARRGGREPDRGGRSRCMSDGSDGPRASPSVARLASRVPGSRSAGRVPAATTIGSTSSAGGLPRPAASRLARVSTVRLALTTSDDEHCFAVDAFRIEKRRGAGRPSVVDLTPDRAGSFAFYCCLELDAKAAASARRRTVD